MKIFLKNDYYLQLSFLFAGLFAAIIGCFFDFGIMLFYFVVGIPQLISFILKAFQKEKKSWIYIIYGIFILPVWICILLLFSFNNKYEIPNFCGYILIISLIYSPILAVLYVVDNYNLYKSLK